MKKQNYISLTIATAILFALTICGSFYDLAIAKIVYLGETPEENIFGIIFSYIGIIPTFVGWSFLGSGIFYLSKKQIENTKKRRWLIAFAILLFVLSFFYFCNTLYLSTANKFKMHFALAYSIGIAVICIATYLGYKFSKKCENSKLLSELLFLSAVSLLTLLIISITKELMCRPRFRFVLAMDNLDYFRNWWQSGRTIKKSLGANIVTDEFASLPSGHSAYSLFAIFLFPTLADYSHRLKKYRTYFFAFGFVWWAMTALSRLTIGAHYLTDITIAGLVTILAYLIVFITKKIYLKRKTVNAENN